MKHYSGNNCQPNESGESFPLGSTIFPQGVNFSLFCKNGTSVALLLYDAIDDVEPAKVITLDAKRNRTYHYWHIFVPGLAKGQLYAYRIDGPFEPSNGHRFDTTKALLDPYSNV